MHRSSCSRRNFLMGMGATTTFLALGASGLLAPAKANTGLAPTETMRGGANNYIPNAPLVDNLGQGFEISGTVRRAGDGAPIKGARIQIWAATHRGGEREPSNHGSVLTDGNGSFRLEMTQIVPNFGQPHGHLAYDDGAFQTVFLRPVMSSPKVTSLQAHFVLAPV